MFERIVSRVPCVLPAGFGAFLQPLVAALVVGHWVERIRVLHSLGTRVGWWRGSRGAIRILQALPTKAVARQTNPEPHRTSLFGELSF